MQHVDRFARMLALVLLLLTWTDGGAAEFAAPATDGWYVWQVQGSENGASTCCYRWRNGASSKQSCDLDGGHGGSITTGDCYVEGDQISVYVRMNAGKVTKIRALTSDCPVTTRTALNDMGVIPNAASVAWLVRQVGAVTRVSEDAIAAIAAHAGDEAFMALTTLVEDRDSSRNLREQALFWLAQSSSDEAFSYLDRLLGKR
jgi:hypothetical protein